MDIKFDTLKYLVNNGYNTLNNNVSEEINLLDKGDKKFYRKRVLAITKSLFKEDFYNDINNERFKNIFDDYILKMVTLFKNTDLTEIRQKEYDDLIDNISENEDECGDEVNLLDYGINNGPKEILIEDCLNIKNNNKKKIPFLPKEKSYNLKTEKNKKKRNI